MGDFCVNPAASIKTTSAGKAKSGTQVKRNRLWMKCFHHISFCSPVPMCLPPSSIQIFLTFRFHSHPVSLSVHLLVRPFFGLSVCPSVHIYLYICQVPNNPTNQTQYPVIEERNIYFFICFLTIVVVDYYINCLNRNPFSTVS